MKRGEAVGGNNDLSNQSVAVKHYNQGNDGLCGVYAALNAYSYLLEKRGTPLTDDQHYPLFDAAIDCLMRDRSIPNDRSALRIVKNNAAEGGINQQQIAELCISLSRWLKIDVDVEACPKKSGSISFAKLFSRERENGTDFALIVAERGGGHWVAAVPHRLKSHFRMIDNDAPRRMRLKGQSRNWVAGESIFLRLSA